MAEIVIMGELLVEIMRAEEDVQLYETGKYFRGPFPSGAPGIFISTAARLGHSAAIISGVGNDDFGKNILDRLKEVGVDCSRVLISDEASTGAAFVTYFKNGDRKFIFHINHTPAVAAKAPEKTDDFDDTKYFHVMGCSLMASVDFGKEVVKTMHILKEKGAKMTVKLNVSGPFHTALLKPASDKLAVELEKMTISDMNIPVITNVTGTEVEKKEDIIPLLIKQVMSPVKWEDTVNYLYNKGVDTFIEVGPGKTLSGFVKRTVKGVKIYNVEDMKSLEKTLKGLEEA